MKKSITIPYGKSILSEAMSLKDTLIAGCEVLKNNKISEPYTFLATPELYEFLGLKPYRSTEIRNILVNENKRLITVVFTDGEHEIIKCSEEDHFDVNIGVALAITQHLYGSKSKFHKDIAKKIRRK